MKEYVVIKPLLNIRSFPSDQKDDTYLGQLLEGEILYLHDQETIGTTPLGGTSNLWLRDSLNRFVAKEGVKLSDWEEEKKQITQTLRNFWIHSKGQGIAIALLDSGVTEHHPNLSNNIKHIPFVPNEVPIIPHGSRMAGIMTGRADAEIISFCPEVKIYDYKIFQNDDRNTPTNLIAALKDIKTIDEIRVINLSLEFLDGILTPEQITDIDNLIKECIDNKKIVVAATGNNRQYVAYPGRNTDLITIGALIRNEAINFPDGVAEDKPKKDPNCFINFGNWSFCDLTGIQPNDNINSSEATAIFSALVALKLGASPALTTADIKQSINKSTVLIGQKPGLPISKLNINIFLNQ